MRVSIFIISAVSILALGCTKKVHESADDKAPGLAKREAASIRSGNQTTESDILTTYRSDEDRTYKSIYWQPPTTMVIRTDGNWNIFVGRIANMRRTGGVIDQGDPRSFGIRVTFYDGYDQATSRCTGAVLHSGSYLIKRLNYKDDFPNASAGGIEPAIRNVVDHWKCATFEEYADK